MSKDIKFTNIKLEQGKAFVTILVTTSDLIIKGKLYLPLPVVVENPTTENLLFYALNCGNMFISLHECVIMNKSSIEYQPDKVKCFNINLNVVQSCQIVKDDEEDEERKNEARKAYKIDSDGELEEIPDNNTENL